MGVSKGQIKKRKERLYAMRHAFREAAKPDSNEIYIQQAIQLVGKYDSIEKTNLTGMIARRANIAHKKVQALAELHINGEAQALRDVFADLLRPESSFFERITHDNAHPSPPQKYVRRRGRTHNPPSSHI